MLNLFHTLGLYPSIHPPIILLQTIIVPIIPMQSILIYVQWSVHRKYTPFDIFPTRCNITQFIYFWKIALHVSGGVTTRNM